MRHQGYLTIIGVDEVGRGALAGPFVVAAVEITIHIPGVRDSKQIAKENRTDIARLLLQNSSFIRVGQASNNEIDTLGMTRALTLAYTRTLEGVNADLVLADHYSIPTNHRFLRATKGDSLFYPVAAASIVAKAYRDQLMSVYHHFFPGYNFASNVGYGTAEHRQAITEHGTTPLHRRSFSVKKR